MSIVNPASVEFVEIVNCKCKNLCISFFYLSITVTNFGFVLSKIPLFQSLSNQFSTLAVIYFLISHDFSYLMQNLEIPLTFYFIIFICDSICHLPFVHSKTRTCTRYSNIHSGELMLMSAEFPLSTEPLKRQSCGFTDPEPLYRVRQSRIQGL